MPGLIRLLAEWTLVAAHFTGHRAREVMSSRGRLFTGTLMELTRILHGVVTEPPGGAVGSPGEPR
jgi:hypothetical protein